MRNNKRPGRSIFPSRFKKIRRIIHLHSRIRDLDTVTAARDRPSSIALERERAGRGDHEDRLPRCPLCADAIRYYDIRQEGHDQPIIMTAQPCGDDFYMQGDHHRWPWKTFTLQQAVRPPRCPVCGSPPEYQDRISLPGHGFIDTIPGAFHCPNEDREDHWTQPALGSRWG